MIAGAVMGSYLENEVFTLGRIPAIPSRFAPADPDAILFSIPHHLCLLSNLKITFFRCDPVIYIKNVGSYLV